jgi:hypothetical protein
VSRHHDEHLDLCASFAVGALDEARRAELESHLSSGCETCLEELRALSGGVTVLALALPFHAAPPPARARVLGAVRAVAGSTGTWGGHWSVPSAPAAVPPVPARATAAPAVEGAAPASGPAPPAGARATIPAWAWALPAVLLAFAGAFAWQRAEGLARELEQARARNAALRESLDAERLWAALLESPYARIVRLAPTPAADTSLVARVVHDPGTRRAILVGRSFKAVAGRDYQLWAVTANGHVSLGVLVPDRAGRVLRRLEDTGEPSTLAGFAVSLEPAGSPGGPMRPAGPIVLFGPIGN